MLLLSLSDYVQKMSETTKTIEDNFSDFVSLELKSNLYNSIVKYNNFLRTPLTLELFTSGKYFKDITVQQQEHWQQFYRGIRVFHWNEQAGYRKNFSEVFKTEKEPTHYKTIQDLTKYHLELQDSLTF